MNGLDVDKLRESWKSDGYIVLDQFVQKDEMDKLKKRINELIDGVQDDELNSVFTTGENQQKSRDQYFFQSGDKIRYFLEEKAERKDNKLVTPKHLAINKIGHALHELDPTFKKFSITPEIVKISKDILGYSEPVICQSMYIMKQPYIGGAVSAHQDSTYLYTTPETVSGIWFAIDDSYVGNACLWVVPGSHKGPLRTRMILNETRDGSLHTPPIESITNWPDDKQFVPVEVKKGSIVIFHGRLCHKSDQNSSSNSRHAYVFHIVDATSQWDNLNWLQSANPFTPLKC